MYLLLQQPHYQYIALPRLQISELTFQLVLQASLWLPFLELSQRRYTVLFILVFSRVVLGNSL